MDIESETLLDKTLFEFFDRCYLISDVLANHASFLNFLKDAMFTDFLSKKRYRENMR